ncbi:BCCT family transporter [Natronosporangium hydrolyticum]|uniref:BCCT family transporter n=1 Tax=Natronosporangium hydrolyticum TaxID=2811111 RepID=A0A895YBP8_9ACTN|nr:BCCT family transporter [Natronosporangium hydrolyticum]QSB13695.1 BCCT family transporter [Natronosporangium hydrolyticum]
MRLRLQTNPVVFGTSVLVIVVFLIAGIAATDTMGRVFDSVQSGIANTLGWYYILVVTGFLVFVIWLGTSRFGRIRLGPPDSRPEYRYLTWFAMLFTAGMGIGLVFWAVAEPLQHLAESPTGGAGNPDEAMRFTFFHWGLHAWAIYIVVGVSLAYFAYRHNLPLSIRSALYPLLGNRIHGRIGDLVDIFAVFGTMFGVATSLGFGILQVNAGLASLGIIDQSITVQLVLIGAITLAAIASLMAGLDKGILRLSVTNLTIGVVLMLFVLVVAPDTLGVLASFVQQTGQYVQLLPETSMWTGAPEWQAGNTIFYWGWWISWSPFVGMFIARVSRGRTIREFVFGVLLVPVTLTFLWMAIFGNSAFQVDERTDGELSQAASEGPETALFGLLESLPLTAIMTVLAILLVATYFVTSSDSASLVIDMLTSGGRTDAPKIQKVFWATLEGAIAGVLLLAGAGGLAALQTAAVTTALPFSVIMLVMCWGLVRALYADDHQKPLAQVTLVEASHEPVPERVDERRSPFKDHVQGSP